MFYDEFLNRFRLACPDRCNKPSDEEFIYAFFVHLIIVQHILKSDNRLKMWKTDLVLKSINPPHIQSHPHSLVCTGMGMGSTPPYQRSCTGQNKAKKRHCIAMAHVFYVVAIMTFLALLSLKRVSHNICWETQKNNILIS